MSYTTIAYSGSINSATLIGVPGVPDPTVRVQGNDILVPVGFNRVLGVYSQNTTGTFSQLVSPSIRRRYPFDLARIDTGATPTGPLIPYNDLYDNPVLLDDAEQLDFNSANGGGGATISRGIVFLGNGDMTLPQGEAFTIRCTGTTTLVAESFTNVALTLTNQLPYGEYMVVGARFQSATGIAARLVGAAVFERPGAVCVNTVSEVDLDRFRYGNSGPWLKFQSVTPPTVDFLATAGDTAQTVHLDLVKVS